MRTYRLIDGGLAPAPETGATEITLDAWRAGARPEAGRFALVLPNDVDLAEIGAGVRAFDAVILSFPTFRDGRAFSQARLLRERYGFSGEVRARGALLRDLALFMARAGIDAFEIGEDKAPGFTEALGEFTAFYQPAADAVAPVWRRRAARAAAA